MGYLVAGFCHASEDDAVVHLQDIHRQATPTISTVTVSGTEYLAVAAPAVTSDGGIYSLAAQVKLVTPSSGAVYQTYGVPFLWGSMYLDSCPVESEGVFMPWAGGPDQSLVLADLGAVGALVFAAFMGFMKGGQR